MMDYLDLKYEQRRLARELASTPKGQRKSTLLVLAKMRIDSRIFAYEAAREALAQQGRAA